MKPKPVAEYQAAKEIDRVYHEIRQCLRVTGVNLNFRTWASFGAFLPAAWDGMRPNVVSHIFDHAAEAIRSEAEMIAERLLPGLILNIALLRRDSEQAPDRPRVEERGPVGKPSRDWREFQKRQRSIELGDRFVSYIDEGKGPPVVLLHGIPTWGFLWNNTIPALARNHRVLVPDLPGFGYSDKRDSFDRSIGRQTEFLLEWLRALKLNSAHIVAHDIGGGIALRLAALHSERVASLCVMNTVCYDSWPIEMMLQLGHPSAYRALSASGCLRLLRQALKSGFHRKPDSKWLDGLLSPWRTEVGKLSLIRNASALNTNLTTEITRLLPRLTVPTLALWGEDDQFQLVKYGERLDRDIPGAIMERISQARHFVMIDQPQAVHTGLRTFLNKVS